MFQTTNQVSSCVFLPRINAIEYLTWLDMLSGYGPPMPLRDAIDPRIHESYGGYQGFDHGPVQLRPAIQLLPQLSHPRVKVHNSRGMKEQDHGQHTLAQSSQLQWGSVANPKLEWICGT